MEYSRIKALMLGWEFPPIVTGGLGAASYGLAKALSSFVDLTILLPKSDSSARLKKVNVLGLNHFIYDEPNSELILADTKIFFPDTTQDDENPVSNEWRVPFDSSSAPEFISLLNEQNPYGPRIIQKVQAYAEIVNVLCNHLSFDLIHAHDWMTYPAAVYLKQKTSKPLLVHVHSLETDRSNVNTRNQIYQIEKNGMNAADRVLPVSAYTKDQIMEYYGIDANKIFPIYNAVEDEKIFHHSSNRVEKNVLFLGRITRQKGPEFLFETMQKLCPKMPVVKFIVVGDGDQSDDLKNKVSAAGLSERVVFTGFVKKEKVHELLASASAYFMPSVSEPFGLSALEAAQFNVPCVISKQSGVSEVLHHVLKADFWDTDKMADYLYAVMQYEGLRKTMVRLCTLDLQDISWDSSAREVLKLYKHVLNPAS